MSTHRVTIAGLRGHPISGLWQLGFTDGTTIYIESGTGVRALAHCFGATEGTGDLLDKIVGQEIVYTTSEDSPLVMGRFTPAAMWDAMRFECLDCGRVGSPDEFTDYDADVMSCPCGGDKGVEAIGH